MLKIFKARQLKRENEIFRLQTERKALALDQHYLKVVEATLSPNSRDRKTLEDADEADWGLVGSDAKRLDEQDYVSLRDQAQKFYNKNGHARNVIRLIEKYVVGRGFVVTPKSVLEEAKEVWKEFWKANKMNQRAKEIVRRVMRDGEVFIRWFKVGEGYIIRFMNPALVAEPVESDPDKQEGNPSHGIETNREDIEDVFAFWYKEIRIPAEEVQFHKIFADSDEKRGRSYLEVVAEDIAMYKKWRKDRMKLNTVRAAIGIVRKVKGSSTEAANIASGYETSRRSAPDGSTYQRAPEGVSMLTTQGIDYEMLSPNLQAADVQHDGRAILVAIAAGVGLPEYMVTSDASNANYSSTMVAEAPGTREFYDWQDFFKDIFEEMYVKVITDAIESGRIPATEVKTESVEQEQEEGGDPEKAKKEDAEAEGEEQQNLFPSQRQIFKDEETVIPTQTEADVIFPELIHRDILKETSAYNTQVDNRWMSNRTAQIRLDLDPDEEDEQIRKEEQDRDERESFTELNPEDEEFAAQREKEMQTEPAKKEKSKSSTKEFAVKEESTGIAKVAKDAVAAALASGKLRKPSKCTKCGKQKSLLGHHPDYTKPLAVVWLCRDCHPPVAKATTGKKK